MVDDGSTDSTRDIARFYALKDARVQVLELDKNGGPARARNQGAQRAKHAILAFLDADDEYLPNALNEALGYFWHSPERPAIRLNVAFTGYPAECVEFPGFADAEASMAESIASSLVIRRAVFNAMGGFPEDHIFREHGHEDFALQSALMAIYGYDKLLAHKHVRHHYHVDSHVARFFRSAAGTSNTWDGIPPSVHTTIAWYLDDVRVRLRAIESVSQ
ncbi:Glycosyltransferase involved in cell wall biogeneis [Candidatus Burkholderia verschuerenii]|uniref:Glycosyltransferase involved in cell wall biogeneis n=1 Tax=Candidatus Burkholderia verschuerenii TaxID=242163 RepID=A0A0L0MAN8_9BURK|nr:Glycosyltransferase involved in cell wall biogeneis [Candidatus Burkholderia verschuerenii]